MARGAVAGAWRIDGMIGAMGLAPSLRLWWVVEQLRCQECGRRLSEQDVAESPLWKSGGE
jgi:hypothetical protein